MTRPRGTGWRRVASVTPGGRGYFWYRRYTLAAGREVLQWIVWRRDLQQWIGSIDWLGREVTS